MTRPVPPVVDGLEDVVQDRLHGLGATAAEVAATLAAAGYRGRIGHADTCPIARYLAADPRVREVAVSGEEITAVEPGGGFVSLTTPRVVARFVYDFDDGAFPALIGGRDDAAEF